MYTIEELEIMYKEDIKKYSNMSRQELLERMYKLADERRQSITYGQLSKYDILYRYVNSLYN